jgi:D-ribose pyranase
VAQRFTVCDRDASDASRASVPADRLLTAERATVLRTGILNPAINSLLSRVRHTNTLVIADRGFPFWPQVETIDISLVDNIPRVLEVLEAIKANFFVGKIWMAEEFKRVNDSDTVHRFERQFENIALSFEPHEQFKRRVPSAIGIIRTGDTIQYANMMVESA